VEHDFWLERWKNNEIGFHQELINPWLAYYYGEMGPPPEKRDGLNVFVPLCGKSKDMLWLSQNGYSVVGLELCDTAVKDFFTESQLQAEVEPTVEEELDHTHYSSSNIRIVQGDFFTCKAEQLGKVTDVFDRASLIALPEAMRRDYAAKLIELLAPGTRVLLVTLSYPQHEMDGPPFSVPEQEVSELFAEHFNITKLAAKDTLQDEPRFAERGLTSLTETAYKMTRL